MRLLLTPTARFSHGKVSAYAIELPSGETAELTLQGSGWELTINASGKVVRRGLFATTHDALMVLEAEYFPAPYGSFPARPT